MRPTCQLENQKGGNPGEGVFYTYLDYHASSSTDLLLAITQIGKMNWSKGNHFWRKNSDKTIVGLLLDGKLSLVENQTQYQIAPGEVFIQHRGKDYSLAPHSSTLNQFLLIYLDGTLLDSSLLHSQISDICLLKPPDERHTRNFQYSLQESIELLSGPVIPGHHDVGQQAFKIIQFLNDFTKITPEKWQIQALQFLENNLDRKIKMNDLANQLGMSVQTLNRKFVKKFGKTCGQIHLHMKIQKAKSLLQTGKMGVSQTAYALGYEDPAHFCDIFKKKTGMTPRVYKQSLEA